VAGSHRPGVVNRRGLLAAVLGFLYPGLGHAYLRAWLRAVSWFLLALATAALVVPESAYVAFQNEGFQGLLAASENFGPEVTLSLLAVRVFNVVDAYIVAVQQASPSQPAPGDEGDAAACPSCGKELDEDLDFCPWCTQRLEPVESDADAGAE
jgi:uncharacterized paraquat-inducible protein A